MLCCSLAFFRDQAHGFSFLLNEILGTTFFSATFYGAFYLAEMRFPVLDRTGSNQPEFNPLQLKGGTLWNNRTSFFIEINSMAIFPLK